MKKRIGVLIVLLAAAEGFAAEFEQGLGLFAGMSSGSGFSYRRMGTEWGFQFTFGLYASSDKTYKPPQPNTFGYNPDVWKPDPGQFSGWYGGKRREISGNLGVNLYKPLHVSEKTLFYVLGGISDYVSHISEYEQKVGAYDITDSTYTWGPLEPAREVEKTKHHVQFGAGLGFTWKITQNIRFSFEWPLIITNDWEVNMYIPQGGIHYFFK